MTAEPQIVLLHIYIASDVAVKVTLTEWPKSVEELINILWEKVKPSLDFEFTLQYEDPDFGGYGHHPSRVCKPASEHLAWQIPCADVFLWSGACPWRGKCGLREIWNDAEINQGTKAQDLREYGWSDAQIQTYPSDRDIGIAVTAHPSLKEPESESGCYGGKMSLKFKMANFCTKLARSGRLEVSVNTGGSKNTPEKKHPHSNMKRARRAEVNYLPNFPRGESSTSLKWEFRLLLKWEKTANTEGRKERFSCLHFK